MCWLLHVGCSCVAALTPAMARAAVIVRGSGAQLSEQSGELHLRRAGGGVETAHLPAGQTSATHDSAASGGVPGPSCMSASVPGKPGINSVEGSQHEGTSNDIVLFRRRQG